MSKQRTYFGTDGIRGTVGQYPITPDFVLHLGAAFGRVLHQKIGAQRPTVLIGKDTRVSGYMMESALEAGLTASGVDVRLTGPLPTPAIAYLTRALRLDAGIVISASHNPYADNGIKFFSAQGNKLDDATELAIEHEVSTAITQKLPCVHADQIGKVKRIDDAAGRYIEFCKSTFPNELDLKGLKIVVDCAHGASYHIAPHVLHELGAEVITIGSEPNGYNINDRCGATHLAALQSAVLTHEANLGIALDGDADRLMMVDDAGSVVDGDQLLFLMAMNQRQIGGSLTGVVGTLMSNYGLEQAFATHSIPFVRAKVGDRYVLETLIERGWLLGGENSGHLIHLGKHTTGDGIVSCLQVLELLQRSHTTLAKATQTLTLYPQEMINVHLNAQNKKLDWQHHAGFIAAQEQAQQALAGKGRVLVRASGTEPVLRIMVEAKERALAQHWTTELAHVLQNS